MEFYFIRHTAVDVPPGYMYGQTDVGLKETFEEEAEKVKEMLSSLTPDAVYTSPLSRCTRLCRYCGYTAAIPDDRLKELNFGEWEMRSFQELSGDSRCEQWFADWLHFRLPGGESFTDQYNRVCAFMEQIRNSRAGQVIVFAHGGVITCARVYAQEYAMEAAFSHIPAYGEVVKLCF
ncbi:MAG: alpha-ribazole phosphatase [Tannerellaceae bacterium]|nr:alpha-ribazole phosphatase [Tannerellaceae bacterium]